MSAKFSRPVIFDYSDYRAFLRDSYRFLKETQTRFSFRKFSAEAGFKAPNALKLLIDGKRNLTLQSIRKVIKALKLSSDEGTFFKNLVFMNQAESTRERLSYAQELCKSRVFRELYPLESLQFAFYNEWYHIPIRELVASLEFQEDPEWIARRLRDKITPEQATQALSNLIELGLLKRDGNGRLRQAHANITTGHEISSSAVAEFHRQMMKLASDSIDEVERHRREISSSTILVDEKSFPRIKELVQEFRRRLLAEAGDISASSSAVVYQISFHVFPLTDAGVEPRDEGREDTCRKAA
ncbi:MAG: TIGR02147 family protein [Bdellovibrionales bacterium]